MMVSSLKKKSRKRIILILIRTEGAVCVVKADNLDLPNQERSRSPR